MRRQDRFAATVKSVLLLDLQESVWRVRRTSVCSALPCEYVGDIWKLYKGLLPIQFQAEFEHHLKIFVTLWVHCISSKKEKWLLMRINSLWLV